ncbi:MAG: enolase C-terminal domain-like protein [Burkholderiaceae bacterium]
MTPIPVARITGMRVRPVLAPMALPLQTANGSVETAPLVLIDLQTDQGVVGRSYLFAISAAHLKPIVALLEAMSGMLKGQPLAPFEIERLLRRRYGLLGVHNIVLFAISGIDMAAWDAATQMAGQPLVRLLGGVPTGVPAYNSKGLGLLPLDALADQAQSLLAEGFRAVKMRLGRPSANDDLLALRLVREAIGPHVTLMCDFNQGLSVNEAIRRGRLLDDEGGLLWIEEPIRADDFEGCARVANAVRTPISLGENFMGPEQMAQALSFDCCAFVMPDVQRIGGVTGWLRAAALAQAKSLDMSSHLFPEISAHLLAVTPTCHWLEYVDWAEPVLGRPVQIEDGRVMIPDLPGSGIAWDEQAVARYAA